MKRLPGLPWRSLVFGLAAALLSSNPTHDLQAAADAESVAEPAPAERADVTDEPDALFGTWGGLRTTASEHGIQWSVTEIVETLGNVSGGIRRGVVIEGLLKASLDVDLKALVHWPGAHFHISGLYPHGESLSEHYLGDSFTLSNIDAKDSPRLFEIWLEQTWWDDRISLRAGQLAADEEFAGTDYGCLFINGTCGWPGFITLNVPSPAFPIATPGARLGVKLSEQWHFQTAVFNGDPDPLDERGRFRNRHGTLFPVEDGALVLAELQRSWNQQEDADHPGFCKAGGWWHSGEFPDRRRDSRGLSLADPASTGIPRSYSGNYGAYLAAQQAVWREPTLDRAEWQGLGVFLRAGFAPSERNFIQRYIEGGANYIGLLPGRPADEFGVATVFGQVSDEDRRLAREQRRFTSSTDPLPDYEMVVETTYRIEICPGWSLQPCVEFLIHPGGSAARQDALVVGVRSSLEF